MNVFPSRLQGFKVMRLTGGVVQFTRTIHTVIVAPRAQHPADAKMFRYWYNLNNLRQVSHLQCAKIGIHWDHSDHV